MMRLGMLFMAHASAYGVEFNHVDQARPEESFGPKLDLSNG
jgi:hypothetical protein